MNFLHDKFEKLILYQAVYIHGRSIYIYIYAILFSPTLFKKKIKHTYRCEKTVT